MSTHNHRAHLSVFHRFLNLALPFALAFGLASCASDAPNAPDHHEEGPFEIAVDEKLEPVQPTLPGFEDGVERPLAAMADQHGQQAEFVENELWVCPFDETELAEFVDRWDGQVISKFYPQEYGLSGLNNHYLVRVDASKAELDGLEANLAELGEVGGGRYGISSESALRLLAASAQEAMRGMEIGINWVGRGSSLLDGSSSEAPAGMMPGYDPDAFTWPSHSQGSNQDIGVGEAWRMLAVAGKLENRIKVAVLDMGFSETNDWGDPAAIMTNIPLPPMEQPSLGSCGDNPCPWHGTKVVSAAMALADDGFGAAGPGGPVAEPVLVFTYYDYFTSMTALGLAYSAGARIANMSYSAVVPASVSWTVLPFNAVTLGFRAAGMLMFASAGNDGADVDDEDCAVFCWESNWHTPCENGGVICVGGLDFDSNSWDTSSNFGNEEVDIFAPFWTLVGQDPANPGNQAQLASGTSFSSPFAAGVAALVWAANPSLSADEVESILMSTAHSSPHPFVRRYVNAAAAVAQALGDAPPYLEITGPTSGSSFPRGSTSVSFSADARDLEDGTPSVRWTSSIDEFIGTGTFFAKTDLSIGTHTITAEAEDTAENKTSDSIVITITGSAPIVEITTPEHGEWFYQGQSISVAGTSYDPNVVAPLSNSAVFWRVDDVTIGTGHSRVIPANSLSTGLHQIAFYGDNGVSEASDSITIQVLSDPADVPPSVQIDAPANGASIFADNYDESRDQWYYVIPAWGSAQDPEDGNLPWDAFVWKAQAAGGSIETVGTGWSAQFRLYATQSFGTDYTITLEVTDSAGNVSSTSVEVTIQLLS